MKTSGDDVSSGSLSSSTRSLRLDKLKGYAEVPQPLSHEQEHVETLMGIMGDSDPAVALRVLRKHRGDIQAAATAILEGDNGEPDVPVWTDPRSDDDPGMYLQRTPSPSRPEKMTDVIDLTGDDDEKEQLSRALKASVEELQNEITFGPSNRPPDPNWAMVPSNTAMPGPTGMSQDEQSLSRAIEESLAASYNDSAAEVMEELPLEKRVRQGGRPVALRPTSSTQAYAALLLHTLFFVPQVRELISRWRPSRPPDVLGGDPGSPDYMVWSLLEIFGNMDLSQMSELSVDAALVAFSAESWSSGVERPGDLSYLFMANLAWVTELELHRTFAGGDEPWPRLFHFRYGQNDLASMTDSGLLDRGLDRAIVKVEIREHSPNNDLISCLSAQLAQHETVSQQEVITQSSDVVAFQLVRVQELSDVGTSKSRGGQKECFRYPKHIYLDQFLKENIELANTKRNQRREMDEEVHKLTAKRRSLTAFDNKDTLGDLRSSLYYYEHVAEDDGDPDRKSAIQDTAIKLRKILTRIENEIETLDGTITRLQSQSAVLFDCPELQHHRYDLRAVLVHDGLFGRNHLYSYVQQAGVWWKTVDYTVTEVAEDTVLTDPAGLHLGAGPYFLFYSRALTEEQEIEFTHVQWPEILQNDVNHNNKLFLDALSPDIVSQMRLPLVSTEKSGAFTPVAASEQSFGSDEVEAPESRGEPMDESG